SVGFATARPPNYGRPASRGPAEIWRLADAREVRRALVITQPHLPPTELLAKNPVLLAQVIDHVQLMLVHPPGDGDQHEPERIHHSRHLVRSLSRASCLREEPARIQPDSVFGPYGSLQVAQRTRLVLMPDFSLTTFQLASVLAGKRSLSRSTKALSFAALCSDEASATCPSGRIRYAASRFSPAFSATPLHAKL